MSPLSSIVFSSWKKSLDIASAMLEGKDISFLRVDGSVPFKKRRNILKSFQTDQDARVLLMTLGTGAEG
jgi:SWI/SNF-related matrix-associated actin-dependent regulator of chromatin subfamily A3